MYECMNQLIDQVGRVIANGPGDLGSIPGRVIPNTFKMVLDTSLLNIKKCKVRIKGKVERSRERSSALLYTSVIVAIEKGAFWSPSTPVASFTFYYECVHVCIWISVCAHQSWVFFVNVSCSFFQWSLFGCIDINKYIYTCIFGEVFAY